MDGLFDVEADTLVASCSSKNENSMSKLIEDKVHFGTFYDNLLTAGDTLWVCISKRSESLLDKSLSGKDPSFSYSPVSFEPYKSYTNVMVNIGINTSFWAELSDEYKLSISDRLGEISPGYTFILRRYVSGRWICNIPLSSKCNMQYEALDFLIRYQIKTVGNVDLPMSPSNIFGLSKKIESLKLPIQAEKKYIAGFMIVRLLPNSRLDKPISLKLFVAKLKVVIFSYSESAFNPHIEPLFESTPSKLVLTSIATRRKSIISQQMDSMSKRILHLKKHEVSFLVGVEGSRITNIRNITGCSIRIGSLERDLTNTHLPLKNRPQDVHICGHPRKLDNAVRVIRSILEDYRKEKKFNVKDSTIGW